MRHDAYYLIGPQETLRRRIASLGFDEADWVLDVHFWHKTETDRSAWGRSDHLAQVKLLFVSWNYSEYGHTPEYNKLFKYGTLSVDFFDAWWTIEVHHSPDEVNDIERGVSPEVALRMKATDRPVVNAWLASLAGNKKKR